MTPPPVADPIRLLRLQLAVENGLPPDDTQWAVYGVLQADGACRLFPLRVRDVADWASAHWDAPLFTPGWSMEPDA